MVEYSCNPNTGEAEDRKFKVILSFIESQPRLRENLCQKKNRNLMNVYCVQVLGMSQSTGKTQKAFLQLFSTSALVGSG